MRLFVLILITLNLIIKYSSSFRANSQLMGRRSATENFNFFMGAVVICKPVTIALYGTDCIEKPVPRQFDDGSTGDGLTYSFSPDVFLI